MSKLAVSVGRQRAAARGNFVSTTFGDYIQWRRVCEAEDVRCRGGAGERHSMRADCGNFAGMGHRTAPHRHRARHLTQLPIRMYAISLPKFAKFPARVSPHAARSAIVGRPTPGALCVVAVTYFSTIRT